MKRLYRNLLCFLLVVSAVWLLPSAAEAAKGGKLIALTFDDGPGKPTAGLLDGLGERGVHATFFMLGNCAERYPSTVARVYREGHQIANHSWSHANMIYLGEPGIADEFGWTNDILSKNAGRATDHLARVPYGSYNDTVRASVGMPIIGWSIDPLDWKYRNAETVRNNIVSAAFDGAIILVHDIHPTSVDGALRAVDDLTAAGYEFVTVRELFRRRGIDLQNGAVYRSAPPNGTDHGPVSPPAVNTELRDGKLTVTLTAGVGADIWCTLDGSDPALYGWKYTAPFAAWAGLNVRAVAAYSLNGSRSEEISVTLANPRAEAPGMTVKDGRLALDSPDPDAEIYFTTDGTPVGENGIRYEKPVTLEPDTVVRACAGGDKQPVSEEAVGWFSPGGRFFRDVMPDDWFAEAADAVTGAGWIQGTGNDCFSPSTPLYRGQLVTILHRMAGKPEPEEELTFPDVRETDYFLKAARWAVASGIAQTGGNGGFSPGGTVTRETFAVMLCRYLLLTGAEHGERSPVEFRDGDAISPSAREAVDEVSAAGILIGDAAGYFHPQDPLTRAETAVILTRLLPAERGE